MKNIAPRVGDWYRTQQKAIFEVVALDQQEGSVEIQYFDGDVEEIDLEAWFEMGNETSAPPEDWSGPYDGVGREELGDAESAVFDGNMTNVLDDLDRQD